MSRVFKRCCKGEQSLVREEGVRPSLVVVFASSEPGPLVLLAQDGTQPPPNETIKVAELEWCGVLEIAEPSPQRRVDIRDDPREAVTSAAYRLGPHLVLERFQALLSHEPATRLEPVAEEIESLPRLLAVDDPRLVRMQRQAVGRSPRLHFTQRSYRRGFRLAEDHEVVGVTHHPAPVLLHQQVERVQVDVGQQRREDCPLGRSRRRQPARHVRHDLLPEKALDQRQDAPVADRLAHPCHQLVVRDRIEVTLQVGIHSMSEALLQQPIDLPQRIFAASSRPEAVTSRPELDFKDWLNGHLQSRLHDAVLDGRYPERTGLPAAFGNIDPFDRARPVAAVLQVLMKLRQIPLRARRKPRDALTIHACRPLVPLDFPPRGFQGCRPDGLIHHAKPLASFDAVTQRRHHAIRPDRSFRPPPSPRLSAGGVSPLLSLGGTIGVVLLHAEPRASSFLPPFPQGGFASRPSRRKNGCGIMKALTPDALPPNVRSLRLLRLAFPTFRPHPRWLSHGRFVRRLSAEGLFQASPRTSRLATALRRIRFVILRTASSPPDALHPASRRRSLLRLRSCDQLRNGLTPFCQSVLTDALVPADAGTHNHRVLLLKRDVAPARSNRNSCGYGSRLKAGTTPEMWHLPWQEQRGSSRLLRRRALLRGLVLPKHRRRFSRQRRQHQRDHVLQPLVPGFFRQEIAAKDYTESRAVREVEKAQRRDQDGGFHRTARDAKT